VSLFGGKREDVPAGGAQPPATAGTAPRAEARVTATKPGHGGKSDMANIGKSIAIKGDLTGNEDMVIEGKVDGKVELPNNQLTVGANGTVRAEVHAKSVVVIGRVTGNVHGTERVEIQATGIVEGDVNAPRLVVAEGAVINGAIHMTKQEGAAAASSADVRKVG
jgi:cytoskeletal protein CcmA (bactofilin family)